MIHLIYRAGYQPPPGPIDSLTHHFALQCADIDGAKRMLAERGIEFIERRLPDHGYRQVFFRDPDGNLLELGEWPEVTNMIETHRRQDHEATDELG